MGSEIVGDLSKIEERIFRADVRVGVIIQQARTGRPFGVVEVGQHPTCIVEVCGLLVLPGIGDIEKKWLG